MESLKVAGSIATLDLPLLRMRELVHEDPEGEAAVTMRNGDIIKGQVPEGGIEVKSILGDLVIPWPQVERMTLSLAGGPQMPAGEGPLAFGGVNWTAWRVDAEVRDDKLVTLPKARAGFHYGHSGNGRSATLVTNVGNRDWKDYRVEFDVALDRVDPAFNPHRVGIGDIGVSIMFRVADMRESWNDKGWSSYSFSMSPKGTWSVRSIYNHHCPGQRGYRKPLHDGVTTLAEGGGVSVANRKSNRVAIEIKGKRIQIWIDGKRLVDVTDDNMNKEVGGVKLDHGGVAVQFGFEGMGSISNFSATRL